MLAVLVSLLLIVSTSLLLYQYWTRALAEDPHAADADGALRAIGGDAPLPAPAFRVDTAA